MGAKFILHLFNLWSFCKADCPSY